MTVRAALLKNLVLFLLVFGLLSFLYSMRLPAADYGGRMVLWIAAMMVLAIFAGPLLLMVLVWTALSHGQPSINSDSDSTSMFDDDNYGPRASPTGEPMRHGIDPSGHAYGTGNRDF